MKRVGDHKYCPGCGKTLNVKAFYADVARNDMMRVYCKVCDGRLRAQSAGRLTHQRINYDPVHAARARRILENRKDEQNDI